jgi:hypothetical protein
MVDLHGPLAMVKQSGLYGAEIHSGAGAVVNSGAGELTRWARLLHVVGWCRLTQ